MKSKILLLMVTVLILSAACQTVQAAGAVVTQSLTAGDEIPEVKEKIEHSITEPDDDEYIYTPNSKQYDEEEAANYQQPTYNYYSTPYPYYGSYYNGYGYYGGSTMIYSPYGSYTYVGPVRYYHSVGPTRPLPPNNHRPQKPHGPNKPPQGHHSGDKLHGKYDPSIKHYPQARPYIHNQQKPNSMGQMQMVSPRPRPHRDGGHRGGFHR